MRHRVLVSLLAALILLVAAAGPALANHRPGFSDGPNHAFGEMVAYPLVFPVGPGHTYGSGSDSFYALRYGTYVGPHHAQDVMAPKMTPVYAAANGTVERVNWSTNPDNLNARSCCSMIIDHDDGWESWYLHLNNDTPGTDDRAGWGIADGIVPGARVSAGQLIGWVGDSGNAENTPPHLHFELRDQDGVWVNPHDSLVAALNGTSLTPSVRLVLASSEVIRPGDRGPIVTDLQAILTELGYSPGPIDGIHGPQSVAALEAFQEGAGVFVDGKLGSQTRAALRTAEAAGAPPSGSSEDPDDPTLRPGDRNEAVRELQADLNEAGYDAGTPDGAYGTKTTEAVRAFQRDQGLYVDGKAGANTLARLAEVLGTPQIDASDLATLRLGDRGDGVELAQTLLQRAGFDPGPIDGVFGSGTQGAARDFQADASLTADGVIGRRTWEALLAS
ncbi:MAG TPA: peptidoglycan-binding protein [Acidimicrobiia bacterium]|nr:peptidoglycan-binding protein [Acidimicrobiia bacterium]